MNFLKQNFPTVPDNVRHKALEGRNFENFYTPSVYLSDGNILALKSTSGQVGFLYMLFQKIELLNENEFFYSFIAEINFFISMNLIHYKFKL